MNWKQFILFCSTSNLRHQCKYNFYARINENSLALYTHIYFSFSLSLSFSFASSYASFVVALPSFPKPKLYNLLPLSLFVILTIHWYNCSFSICFLSLSFHCFIRLVCTPYFILPSFWHSAWYNACMSDYSVFFIIFQFSYMYKLMLQYRSRQSR